VNRRAARELQLPDVELARPSRTRLPRRPRTSSAGDFTASEPNTKYVGDITYLRCGHGKLLYLATVSDLLLVRGRGAAPPWQV
jgi:transposase InsO family protein